MVDHNGDTLDRDMSCDVAIWHSKTRLTDAEADDIYSALTDGDTANVEAHPGIGAFLDELRGRYPDIDALAEVYPSDAHVLLCMPWSKAVELMDFAERLAKKHALVCFDPQSSVILTQALLE
jgi:hypothetical protein